MKRVLVLVVAALLVTAPVFAQAPDAAKPAAKPAGKTFAVDKDTKITMSGATKKTATLKDAKKPAQITEFVKTGDTVTVQYHDGATKHAAEVLVRSSVKK